MNVKDITINDYVCGSTFLNVFRFGVVTQKMGEPWLTNAKRRAPRGKKAGTFAMVAMFRVIGRPINFKHGINPTLMRFTDMIFSSRRVDR